MRATVYEDGTTAPWIIHACHRPGGTGRYSFCHPSGVSSGGTGCREGRYSFVILSESILAFFKGRLDEGAMLLTGGNL